jgi:REP element-mobilizing transposase RayT
MSRSSIFTEPLYGGQIFHVYNQTNNKEPLFLIPGDRIRFLSNLEKFVSPFIDIFSFNLLSNHFHLLIEVLLKEEFLRKTPKYYINNLPTACRELINADKDNMHLILKNRFTAMFSGYVTYFNHRHKRKGNFLHRPFCRKWIHSMDYFERAVYYIHANTVRHGIHQNLLEHEWTSYHSVLADDDSLIALKKLYKYFGGEELLKKYHNERQAIVENEIFVIEEETVFQKRTSEEEE